VKRSTEAAILVCLLAIGGCVFLTGIWWGLPSRAVDPFLFGDHAVWSGKEIMLLAGNPDQDKDRAVDVSSKPLSNRNHVTVVNATDQDRARIVRRYRLMSYQPDEFTTFAALSQMKPSSGDLDPRMYKYGGLWVYPIGAMLKLAASVGIVQLTPDAAYYLDHPEAFGRFYIVARLYSAAWGLIGIIAIFLLIRRISGNIAAATCGALCFTFMPVVVNAAHEAKPHLAGTVLMMLTVLAGSGFVESGRRRAALAAALLSGAAIAMVPSALPVLLVLPGMLVLRQFLQKSKPPSPGVPVDGKGASSFIGLGVLILVALLVYFVTNPFVLINLLRHRALLYSNVGNSSAFYHAGLTANSISRSLLLIDSGTSILLGAAGGLAAILLAWRASRVKCTDPQELRRRATGMLLAITTLPTAVAFILFANGQPADYARFALPFDVFLSIEAVVAIATFIRRPRARVMAYGLLVFTTATSGWHYVIGFVRDSTDQTTRLVAAAQIHDLLGTHDHVLLASREEPAPWSLPPVNLFRWRVIVVPRGWPEDKPFPEALMTIGPADFASYSEVPQLLSPPDMSWADKAFTIQMTAAGRAPATR
jgi:hypothetical protein